MNVNELMCREPRAVRMGDRLDAAARVMWEQDCGLVPVVDATNVVVGVLTDRDLCMAAYTQGRQLTEIAVASAMARSVRTCRADESVPSVLLTMAQAQVHRLPVVDARGMLVGVVTTNDLVRTAHSRPAAVDPGAVVKTLAAIGTPRRAAAPATKAGAVAPAMVPAAAPGKPAAVVASVAPASKPATAAAVGAAAAPAASAIPAKGKQKSKQKGRKA